jgi:lipid A 3-O-deacylase
MMRISLDSVAACALLFAFCAPTHAVDEWSLETGYGNKTALVRLGASWDWERRWLSAGEYHLGGYWQGTLAHWRAKRYGNAQADQEDLIAVGITPVLRYQRHDERGWYAELGIGLHLLSDDYNNNGRELSTHFQFGDHIGVGYVFSRGMEIGLSYQHFSNGSIKQPNDGVNFVIVRLAYPF